jgi:hypothetical protein
MKNSFNKIAWLVVISFISVHLYQSLQAERALPSEGWSRSIDLNVKSATKPTS